MDRDEDTDAFLKRLMSLPDPNIKDKKTFISLQERLANAIRPKIEEQDRLQARSLSRAFTKVVR